jgi:hypothetical protein
MAVFVAVLEFYPCALVIIAGTGIEIQDTLTESPEDAW